MAKTIRKFESLSEFRSDEQFSGDKRSRRGWDVHLLRCWSSEWQTFFLLLVVTMGDKETDVNARKQQPHEMHNSELVSKLMGKEIRINEKLFR